MGVYGSGSERELYRILAKFSARQFPPRIRIHTDRLTPWPSSPRDQLCKVAINILVAPGEPHLALLVGFFSVNMLKTHTNLTRRLPIFLPAFLAEVAVPVFPLNLKGHNNVRGPAQDVLSGHKTEIRESALLTLLSPIIR